MDCGQINDCAIKLPSVAEFQESLQEETNAIHRYADLECILEKMETEETSNHKYQYHRVFSLAYYVHCSYNDSLCMYWFRRDCVTWFAEELRVLAHNVKSILSTNVPMEFTRDNLKKFNNATHCHVCEKLFAPNDTRVRDRCHLTMQFRGPTHSNCNLNYKDSHCIPVVFHNWSDYDAHFIIKE